MENGSNAAVDGVFYALCFLLRSTRAVLCLFCTTKAAPLQDCPQDSSATTTGEARWLCQHTVTQPDLYGLRIAWENTWATFPGICPQWEHVKRTANIIWWNTSPLAAAGRFSRNLES